MSLRDTSSAPVTATQDETEAALRWAITAAEHEAARAIRRDSGMDRQTAKRLETTYRGHARALSALSLPPVEGWRPISDEVKDGREVLAFVPGLGMGLMVLFWMDGYWREKANMMGLKIDPTHWMPLPAAPAEVE